MVTRAHGVNSRGLPSEPGKRIIRGRPKVDNLVNKVIINSEKKNKPDFDVDLLSLSILKKCFIWKHNTERCSGWNVKTSQIIVPKS